MSRKKWPVLCSNLLGFFVDTFFSPISYMEKVVDIIIMYYKTADTRYIHINV